MTSFTRNCYLAKSESTDTHLQRALTHPTNHQLTHLDYSTHPSIYPLSTHHPTHTFIHSFTYPSIHSFNHSSTHQFLHSIIHLPINPFIQSFIYPSIHSFTHRLTHTPTRTPNWGGDWFGRIKRAPRRQGRRLSGLQAVKKRRLCTRWTGRCREHAHKWIKRHTKKYSAVQYRTVQYTTVQDSPVQCSTRRR